MESLEIEPIKKKQITIYLVRNKKQSFDKSQMNKLQEILKTEKFRFAVLDFNDKELKETYEEPLAKFLEKFWIPYFSVDIPDYVRDLLNVEIFEKEAQINELEKEYEKLLFKDEEENSFKIQSLHSWIELLQKEVESQKATLESTIRPEWIVKKVLDIAKMIRNDVFSIMHFTHEEIYSELKNLFESYNIKVKKIDISKRNVNKIII
jgi:hypothetical protein